LIPLPNFRGGGPWGKVRRPWPWWVGGGRGRRGRGGQRRVSVGEKGEGGVGVGLPTLARARKERGGGSALPAAAALGGAGGGARRARGRWAVALRFVGAPGVLLGPLYRRPRRWRWEQGGGRRGRLVGGVNGAARLTGGALVGRQRGAETERRGEVTPRPGGDRCRRLCAAVDAAVQRQRRSAVA